MRHFLSAKDSGPDNTRRRKLGSLIRIQISCWWSYPVAVHRVYRHADDADLSSRNDKKDAKQSLTFKGVHWHCGVLSEELCLVLFYTSLYAYTSPLIRRCSKQSVSVQASPQTKKPGKGRLYLCTKSLCVLLLIYHRKAPEYSPLALTQCYSELLRITQCYSVSTTRCGAGATSCLVFSIFLSTLCGPVRERECSAPFRYIAVTVW